MRNPVLEHVSKALDRKCFVHRKCKRTSCYVLRLNRRTTSAALVLRLLHLELPEGVWSPDLTRLHLSIDLILILFFLEIQVLTKLMQLRKSHSVPESCGFIHVIRAGGEFNVLIKNTRVQLLLIDKVVVQPAGTHQILPELDQHQGLQ